MGQHTTFWYLSHIRKNFIYAHADESYENFIYIHPSVLCMRAGKARAMQENLDGGGLIFTIPEKFSQLFISLKFWVIH